MSPSCRSNRADIAPIPIGDSLKVRVGDLVIAIGNPFALEATATLGMISSLRRTTVGFREFESYIQHDAAVNSGNSGGALINTRGELIGINTAIMSPSGGNVGLGFAIPIGIASVVMDQLVKYGRVRRGWNGIKVEDITPDKIKEYGLTVLKGAFVSHVAKGSPAEKVGAKIGDVITAVSLPDGRQMSIENAAQLRAGEAITEVGMTVTLTLVRDGAPHSRHRRHRGFQARSRNGSRSPLRSSAWRALSSVRSNPIYHCLAK